MAKKKKTYKDYLEEIARERQLDTRKELADFESFVEENRPIEAPIRSDLTQEKERSWFSGGAFSDGYDFGDVTKTILGTGGDVASNLLRGVSDVGEGIADLAAGGVAQVADFMGNDDLAEKIRKKLAGEDEEFNKNVERFGMSNKLNKASDFFDKNSLFGEKLDDVTSSAGGLVGSMAGQAVGIPWYLTMGGSSAGRELGNAYQEGATDGEAWLSAGVTGLSEVALEKLSGGIKFGGKSLDELWKGPLTKTITNKTANTLAKFGLDVAGEGGEEVLTEAVQSLGRLSYEEDKTWQEAIASEEAFDNYLEAFIGGGLIGGTFNARRAYNSVKTGRDYETGLTGGEQSVIDAEITNRTTERQKQIAEQQKNEKLEAEIARVIEAETNDRGELTEAKKQALIEDVKSKIEDVDYGTIELSKKELNEIKRQVNEDLERGEIDTFTIENTLFQDSVLRMRELDREMQTADDTRKAEIQAEIDQLQGEVNKTLESNGKLLESYRQKELRKQSFEREVTDQDSDKTKAIVAKAKELGLNNTRQSHEKVDLFIKIAEDSGYDVILTNNEELENKGDYSDEKTAEIRQLKLELKNVSDDAKKAEIQKKIDQLRAERGTIDGFVIKGTGKMFLNVDSPKYIETTVGHEVTHILEENKSYKAYMKFIQDFAKTKGTYNDFKASVESRYKNITKDFDSEIVADLTGEYIFTDQQFVNKLSVEQPNIFKQMYDYIKHVYKMATAGSKEARQLEKAKRMFEKAYREMGQATTGKSDSNLTTEANDKKFLISPNYETDFDDWFNNTTEEDRRRSGGEITIGTTPDVLLPLGVKSGKFVMGKSKIQKILDDHSEMTPDLIKAVPNMVENPIIVLQSLTGKKSVVVYGELLTASGKPIMASLAFTERKNGKYVADLTVLTSAYARSKSDTKSMDTNTADQYLIDNSRMLYVNPDKKITDNWLKSLRLQLPSDITNYGYINKIADFGNNVKTGSSAMADAFKKAQEKSKEDERFSLSTATNGKVDSTESGSVVKYSLSSWNNTDKTAVKSNLVKAGFSPELSQKWIDDVNSISAIIAADKDRLDYVAADNQVMLKNNNEYVKTLDASTLCSKRLLYQGTYNAIQHAMPNTPLLADDVIRIRQLMDEYGYEVPCGICYVESRRKSLGKFASDWLRSYKGDYIPTLDQVTTTDGLEKLRKEHPQTYDDFVKGMNKKGVANPKVVELRTDYRNDILGLSKSQIEKITHIGGLRVQSFSDFETPHLIDMMQATLDMSSMGLTAQAYTKVPNFAWVFGDTGIKINLSLIGDVDANGNLIFDGKEGMPIEDAMALRERYSKNVGTFLVGKSREHILAAMADPRIDFIIPFHHSGWAGAQYEALGLKGYKSFQSEQTEKMIDGSKPDGGDLYSIDYWDFSKTGKENAERYLELCKEQGRVPVFSSFLADNGDGSWSLQPDGSTDGYWKLLIDFKMYDNEGNGSPQVKVTPAFNMEEASRVLAEYEGDANNLPAANDIVEKFVEEYKSSLPYPNTNLSLSSPGDIAPINRGRTRWSDIMLPKQEDIAPVKVTTDPTDIAPVKTPVVEEDLQLSRPLTEEDLPYVEQERDEAFNNLPEYVPEDIEYYNEADTAPIDDAYLRLVAKNMRSELGLKGNQLAGLRKIIQNFSTSDEQNIATLYDAIESEFGTIQEPKKLAEVAEIKDALRTMRIKVSDVIKGDIPDYAKWKQKQFGKIRITNDGLDVDDVYEGLKDVYPGFFPDDIINPTDQLLKIAEVAGMDHKYMEEYLIPEEELQEVTDYIYEAVTDYKQQKRLDAAREASKAPIDESMIPFEEPVKKKTLEDIAPINSSFDRNDFTASRGVQQKYDLPSGEITENERDVEIERLEKKKKQALEDLGDLTTFTKQKAEELYDEVRSMTAGHRVSSDLGYILDRMFKGVSKTDPTYPVIKDETYKRITDALIDIGRKPVKPEGAVRPTEELIRRAIENRYNWTVADINSWELDPIAKTRRELRKKLVNPGFLEKALDEAKDIPKILMNNTDTIRNTELVFGRKNGKVINDLIFQRAIDNEAKSIAWQNKERKEIAALGIKAKDKFGRVTKESEAIQKWGEGKYLDESGDYIVYDDDALMKDFPDPADRARIKKAAKVIRDKYDKYIDTANEVLTSLGFEAIPKRDDYMRHFQVLNDTFSNFGIPFNPQAMQEHTLPTDVNGLTEFWTPQKNYFANIQPRKGMRTTLDAITGIDGYISGIANLIFHTEDIQRGRALEDIIRENYGESKGWDNLANLTEEEQADRAEKIENKHLSRYAAWVHEWTNNLAGKKNKVDRAIEDLWDRKVFTVLDETRKQVGANMIGFNVSSSLTNLISSVQAIAKTNKLAVAKGTADTIRNVFIKDNFAEKNNFLTARMGTEMLSKTAWEKMRDAGYVFMKGMDWFTSNQITRSKYYELRSKGMSEEEAHAEAGKFAARIMGDRTKGANALLYNSKMIGLVTQFQLEVNNQLYSMFYDTYQESKEKAQNDALKTAAGMTFTLGQLFAYTHVFGKTFEAIAGYNPTFDVIGILATALGLGDDEEDKPVIERLQDAGDQLASALPYVSVFKDGGRIPITSGVPNLLGLATGGKDKYGNDLKGEDEAKKLLFLIPPTGGNQIKKTTQGLGMFDSDLPVSGSYTDSGNLRFPVEATPMNVLQAGVFGQWASGNARDYFDNERQPLKEKQIQEYKDLDLPISDYWKYREELKEQKTVEDKFNYIAGLDLPVDKKNIMINNAVDRKESVDLINYDDFGSYEEFDFATRYPEKYEFFESNGISYRDYKESEESKEAYNWAYNNPEKFSVAKAAAPDVVTYRNYAADLNDIKADKDSSGKSISGSRKTKVANYINSLDAEYGSKLILFKSEYPADDRYNNEIVEYLNSRQDISYDEEVTILTELGFTVDANGNVHW